MKNIMNIMNPISHKLLSKGMFAIDKIKNLTSVENLEIIKELIYREIPSGGRPHPLRIGHGGTLDHTATGVLVIGVGSGCKLLPKFLKGNKIYITSARLGVSTDTYNETGKITDIKSYDHVNKEILENALKKFQGKILQTPPAYSALKRGGRRLSDLTMEGKEVELHPRPVKCHSIEIMNFKPPDFSLKVCCGGGFYIRSLIHDLGEALSSCAHVTELRRVSQDPFTIEDALPRSDWTIDGIFWAIERHRLQVFPNMRIDMEELW